MSVAFRRESDDEHLEPKFEIPLPPGPNLVTVHGLDLITARVTDLKSEIAATVDEPRLGALKRDLRYWSTRAATAQLTLPDAGEEASFGSRVTFRLNGAKPRTIDIVGDDEADPAAGRLSFSSPLARAVIGAGVGDRVDFQGKDEAIEITDVIPIP